MLNSKVFEKVSKSRETLLKIHLRIVHKRRENLCRSTKILYFSGGAYRRRKRSKSTRFYILLHPQIEDSPRERFYGFFIQGFFQAFIQGFFQGFYLGMQNPLKTNVCPGKQIYRTESPDVPLQRGLSRGARER